MSYYPHTIYPEPIGLDHDSAVRFTGGDPVDGPATAHRPPSHHHWYAAVAANFKARRRPQR